MKSAAFQHLLKHYRGTKQTLAFNIVTFQLESSRATELKVSFDLGAMYCLYSQALGFGELNLAKGIRRTIAKAEAML